MRSRSARRARIWLASRDLERLRRAGRGGSRIESYTGTNGVGDRHQRSANILSRRGYGGQIDENEEHRRSLGGTNGGQEPAPCERMGPSTRSDHRLPRRTLIRAEASAIQRTNGNT